MYFNSKIVSTILLLCQCLTIYSSDTTTGKPFQKKHRPSAGFVIYRKNVHGVAEFLLLQASYGDFHYSPPKAFVNGSESYIDTALQATEKETGIKTKDINIDHNFARTLKFTTPQGFEKRVYYWLARLNNPNEAIKLSNDHQGYVWWNKDEVLEHVEFIEMKNLIAVCNFYINRTTTTH